MPNEYYKGLTPSELDYLISLHDFFTGYGESHGDYINCSCSFSNSLKEKMPENELPNERIEDADEYKKFFNDEVLAVDKCTSEQILDRIHSLENFIRESRTRVQANHFKLNERKKNMTKAEREKLEATDRAYKVKEVKVEEKERKAPMSKDEKAVRDIMKLLKLSEEDAVKWIKENG